MKQRLKPSTPLTIAITGVTRGLGRAMVDEFVRLGHKVFGCGRTTMEIESLALTYPTNDFQTVNVASDREVKAWSEHLLKRHEAPDLVINNAAVINRKAPLWEVDSQEFSDEIDINLKGVANVIRHFVPSMVSRRRGVIVNFTSRWGTKFEKQMAPYCATKWAVVALTRALAEELKPVGVAAVALNPGIVRTEMLQKYFGSTAASETAIYPTSAEWAKVAVPCILALGFRDTGKLRNIVSPLKQRLKHMRRDEHFGESPATVAHEVMP